MFLLAIVTSMGQKNGILCSQFVETGSGLAGGMEETKMQVKEILNRAVKLYIKAAVAVFIRMGRLCKLRIYRVGQGGQHGWARMVLAGWPAPICAYQWLRKYS